MLMESIISFASKFITTYHIFILSEKLGSFLLKWSRSTGSTDLLKKFVTNNENADVEDNLLLNTQSWINVISSAPGMGKSTLLNQICSSYIDKVWITKINLIEFTTYFDNALKQTKSAEHFFDILHVNNLTKFCFNHFINCIQAVFLIDGFDEISPQYTGPVVQIIEYLKTRNSTVWITTRPNSRDFLEEKFNVLSYHICAFSFEEKISYIKQYCISVAPRTQKILYNHLFNFIKEFDANFSSNALQMFMICSTLDIFLENNPFTKITDVSKLYSNFIKMKFIRYEKKYLTRCSSATREYLVDKLRELSFENYQISSLIAVFGRQQAANFIKKPVITFLEEIKNGKDKTGIIIAVSSEDVPIFLHQTYAEYFAATWLAENFSFNKQTKELLFQVFSSTNLLMVRLFFDRMLSQGLDLFEAVLDQDFDRLRSCFSCNSKCLDKLGRNALHIACSWKPERDSIYLEFLLKRFDAKNDRDKFFNSNAIEYADMTTNIVAIDKILDNFDLNVTELKISLNIKWLLFKCIKKKCITLLREICDCLNKSSNWVISDDYDNLLSSAIETNNLEIVKILLSVNRLRNHIINSKIHGGAPLQFALSLGNQNIVEIVDSLFRVSV